VAEPFDLLVRGGLLVDGTGAPARRGDVAVRGGRIAALGAAAGSARRVIDADGLAVAPGFIDVHTHYDAQVLWDRMLSISPWHGVTTVVMGNCGFGVAPTRPEHRDLVLRTLENVEGMSLDALRAGLGEKWPFESFPEYLAALERRGTAIHVGALLGHTPLRLYVMGEEATEREATPEEVGRMAALAEEALGAGALGFATSKSPTHVGYAGRPVPSRAAAFSELEALADVLGRAGHGVLQATVGRGLFVEELAALQRRSRRSVTWTALLAGMLGPTGHEGILARHVELQREGVAVVPQVSCRPLVFEYQWKAPFPFESLPFFKPVSAADAAGKKAIYADPAFRAAFREGGERAALSGRWEHTVISSCPLEPALEQRNVAETARERGVHPVDLVLDLALATDLEARFHVALLNTDEKVVGELLRHPAVVLGLSDAGAHASQLCDAGFATHLLGHWVREKGVLSLEEGVRLLTGRAAEVFGIEDRGRLAPGLAADLVLFDPATVGCGPLQRVRDLPGGADRLIAEASGIHAVVVEGSPIREEGLDLVDPEGPLPGRVLRGRVASGREQVTR
jgi:N-acyl-D-aspartate/D-glutamate deacylase